MAYVHHAYTFDPIQFHETFWETFMVDGMLQLDELVRTLQELVRTPGRLNTSFVDDIRFDPEWFTEEYDRGNYLYVLSLASFVADCPSLTNRYKNSFAVIEIVLKNINWSISDVKPLIWGLPLVTLAHTYGGEITRRTVTVTINQLGGWIDIQTVYSLRERLLADADLIKDLYLQKPNLLIPSNKNLKVSTQYNLSKLIDLAYADTLDMLTTALERNKALIICLG